MKKTFLKKLVLSLSVCALITNSAPLFAQVVYLDILGGGYKIQGPSQINFSAVNSSISEISNILSFSDLSQTTPSEAEHNYLKIIDENGGNPFDVTVSASEIKRSELLETNTTSGSTASSLRVDSTTGFYNGDTFAFTTDLSTIYTITAVTNPTTLQVTPSFLLAPTSGLTIRRLVDCQISPKKCIPLSNFTITNQSSEVSQVSTINGESSDFTLNAQTNDAIAFKGDGTTLAGSSGTTLKINSANNFLVGETIAFDNSSGVTPPTNVIVSIDDNETITVRDTMSVPPASDVIVESVSSRTLTLGNGTGLAPGEWNINPVLGNTIPAGQMPGLYETTLNFTIL